MTCWGDEVEEGVDAVVAEAGVALDARLLGENVVVLPLEVSNNLGKPAKCTEAESAFTFPMALID